MRTVSKALFFMIAITFIALPLAAGSHGGAQNNSQRLPVEFPGPNGSTLHGHLYVPGVSTKEGLAAVTKKISGDDLQPRQRT